MSYPRKKIKRFDAVNNSQRHLRGVHPYYGVDRRHYNAEPQAPIYDPITERDVEALRRNEQMSMVEIYRMELFLATGSRKKQGVYLKPKDRDRILLEYSLVYDQKQTRYMGDLTEVWAVLAWKYPDAAKAYAGYKECQYALKYGATPLAWGKEDARV